MSNIWVMNWISGSLIKTFIFLNFVLIGQVCLSQSLEELYDESYIEYISDGYFDYQKAKNNQLNVTQIESIIAQTQLENLTGDSRGKSR